MHDRGWVTAMFTGVHGYFVTPPITLLAILAFLPQAHELAQATSAGALDVSGLAVQAVVFTLVGVSWMLRLTMAPELWDMAPLRVLYTWHNLVGWAAVYNLIFAVGQALLYGIARSRGMLDNRLAAEAVPLLY